MATHRCSPSSEGGTSAHYPPEIEDITKPVVTPDTAFEFRPERRFTKPKTTPVSRGNRPSTKTAA